MKRKLMKLSFLLFGLLLLLTACGNEDDVKTGEANQTEGTKTFKIGTTQIMEHQRLIQFQTT